MELSTIERVALSFLLFVFRDKALANSMWASWWKYDGIAGPQLWGIMNPAWHLCSQGKHQSPINIDPKRLVFDPNLGHFNLAGSAVQWTVVNAGHDVTLLVENKKNIDALTIEAGPLSYKYAVSHVKLHFGMINTIGSEHTINGLPFPGELQIMMYNTDIFQNFTTAKRSAHGVVILSVLIQVRDKINRAFASITDVLGKVSYKGNISILPSFNLSSIVPVGEFYMTYFGSFTQPSCDEVVTWVILNRPLFINKSQMSALRKLTRTHDDGIAGVMENNFRPTMAVHRRTVRTNIDIRSKNPKCVIKRDVEYRVNDRFKVP